MLQQSFAARTRLFLSAAVISLPLILSSCGVPQEEHEAVKLELEKALARVTTRDTTIKQQEEQITELEKQVEELHKRLASLEDAEKIKKQYAAVAKIALQQGKKAAMLAYEDFARRYPLNPLSEAAKNEAIALRMEIDAEARAMAEKQAHEKAEAEKRAKAIRVKISHGKASVEEIRELFIGYTKSQVLELLDKPDQTGKTDTYEYWQFYQAKVAYDPVAGKSRGITIRFNERGQVVHIDLL